jgi:hypothetical protein
MSTFDTIVILGNGFDMFFDLPTGYSEFYKYMNKHYSQELDEINEFFNFSSDDTLWKDFENNLANLNIEYLLSEYGDDFERIKELFCCLKDLYDRLEEFFVEWINSIKIPNKLELKFTSNIYFITFNYTKTLEIALGISDDGIYHMHGKVGSKLIYGHANTKRIDNIFSEIHDGEMECLRNTSQVYGLIREYIYSTKKPTDKILKQLIARLRKNPSFDYRAIKNIYVIGHSLSNVDIPYFKWLYQTTRANWVIGYHNDEDYVKIKDQITKNNLSAELMSSIEIIELLVKKKI